MLACCHQVFEVMYQSDGGILWFYLKCLLSKDGGRLDPMG